MVLVAQLFLPVKGDSTQADQSSLSQGPQEGATGNAFLSDCTNMVRILDGESLMPGQLQAGFYCSGYIAGFVDAYGLAQDTEKYREGLSHPLYCLPKDGLAASQGVRIVVKWLREHPETLHQDRKVLVTLAFESAFPCK
jgi:hypothetical protein